MRDLARARGKIAASDLREVYNRSAFYGVNMTASLITGASASPFLSAGSLVLDTHAHKLTGPTGEIDLDVAVFVVLRELMRRPGAVVTLARLTEASWPDPDCEPDDVPQALRQRVSRSRAALKRVGVPGSSLRLSFQVGYAIDGAPRVVRALTPAQAAALDALAATHPAFQPERIAA